MANCYMPTGEVRPPKKGERYFHPVHRIVEVAECDFALSHAIYREVPAEVIDRLVEAVTRLDAECERYADAGFERVLELRAALAAYREATNVT